jgi:hypothetical protein
LELVGSAESAVLHRKAPTPVSLNSTDSPRPGSDRRSYQDRLSNSATSSPWNSSSKPQTLFTRKLSNDPDEAFVPFLTDKPNHVLTLEESLVEVKENGRTR